MGGETGGWVDIVVRRVLTKKRRQTCRSFGDCD